MTKKSGWPTTSRHSRGYGTEWDKIKKRILARDHGLCQPCLKQGYLHPGTEVDHIVSKAQAKLKGWSKQRIDADDNLQCINSECHKRKTAEEQGRSIKDKVVIGIDGFPIEKC